MSKIDKYRWHKQKYFIRINCWLLSLLLLIVLLLMGFPIVSDADEPTVGDYWHMEEILNYEDALSHNGESGYYDVNANIFTAPTFYGSKGEVSNYYDKLKAVFELPFSTFSGVGTNYNMTICKQLNSDNLVIIFDGQSISLNYQGGTYSYIRPPSIYSGSPIYFVFDGSSITSSGYYSGGSYKDITDCDYILFTSCNVNMYYPSYDQNLNYLKIEGKMGSGSGGFGVEEPFNQDQNILDGNYIYQNSCMFVSGSSAEDNFLNVAIDFPTGATVMDYRYVLDMTMRANYSVSGKGQSETTLKGAYGWSSNETIDGTIQKNITFHGTIENSFTHNCFTIRSFNYNPSIIASYTANSLEGSSDYVVTPQPLMHYVSDSCPVAGSFTPEEVVYSIVKNSSVFNQLTMPTYDESKNFVCNTLTYEFNMDIYRGDKKITSVPLGCVYDVLTGRTTTTTNPGVSKEDVDDIINSNNQNKTPTDPDYKNPDDYQPTIDKRTNPSSTNNNNINNDGSSVSSTGAITINNNNNFNPTNNVSSGGKSFISDLISSLFGGGSVQEGNIANHQQTQLITNTGANNWLGLFSTTLGFLPSSLWAEITMFVGIILGILVVGFILRIILDFL